MHGRVRPDLISELLVQSARDKQHQLENQASIVLAWLADRSPNVARALLKLWLGEIQIPGDLATGARNEVPMPSKLRPDISIDVEGRVLQLLIEVKVSAAFAEYDGVLQDQKYRDEWMNLGGNEAMTRAVGTLTRDASELPDEIDLDRLRARDVEWGELRQVLMEIVEGGGIDQTIDAVIRSFCNAIALRIEVAKVDEEGLPAFIQMAQSTVEEIASDFGQRAGVAPTKNNGAHYAGAKVAYEDVDGRPVEIRVFAGTAGGVMTAIGGGPTLVVAIGRDHSGLLKGEERARALEAGMELIRTPKHLFTGLRYDFEVAAANPAAVVNDAVGAITGAKLLPQGENPGRAKKVAAAMDWEYLGQVPLPPDWEPSKSVPQRKKYGPGGVIDPDRADER